MAIINGLNLKEGMFIQVTGMNIKNDNGVYVVEHDYSLEEKYSCQASNSICICKVKTNGEKSTAKYNLNFISDKSYDSNENLEIKIVTDLKVARKEVTAYMKNRESKEVVVNFKESNDKLEKGSTIKFVKGYKFGTFGDKYIGTKSLWEVIDCDNRLEIRELGKRGQYISTGRHFAMNNGCLNQILEGEYLVVLSKEENTVENTIKETEVKATKEESKIIENIKIESNTETTKKETIEDVKIVLNEDKNGVEIYFNNKPSEDVRNNLKSNGFRWSKYNKCWYAKQNEDTLKFANSLTNTTEEEIKQISAEYKEEKEKEIDNKLNELNINDIESYVIDDNLSRRENENGFFRKNDINHAKEIQDYLSSANNEVLSVLENCNDGNIEYNLKMALQRFKRDYHANYIKRLQHKASNPSWAITGRSGLNVNRYNKMNDRYNNMLTASNEIVDKFNKSINRAKNNIRKQHKQELENAINNTNTEDYSFTRCKKQYNSHASNNIFNNPDVEITMTNYNNEYFIFKNWGKYRIYNSEGMEIAGRNSLKDAKKYVVMLIENVA